MCTSASRGSTHKLKKRSACLDAAHLLGERVKMVDARWLRLGLTYWPPFWAAGVRVRTISMDYRHAVVDLRLGVLNRNYVGTHFGGSIFSMTDPFYMLMYMNILGKRHLVWDHSASIRFLKPGRGVITAEYNISDRDLKEVEEKTASGDKFLKEVNVQVLDQEGEVVADVQKVLYFRLKRQYRPTPSSGEKQE